MKYIFFISTVALILGGIVVHHHYSERAYARAVAEQLKQAAAAKTVVATADENSVAEKPTTLLAVGDIMLGRHVETLTKLFGEDYPFYKIDSLLQGSDAVVGNLEGPLVQNHVQTPSMSMQFTFDENTAPRLKKHHIDIVSLANNHTYDYGAFGYTETTQFLHQAGVDTFGHPVESSDMYVLKKTINNKKFIFVGFNMTFTTFSSQDALKTVEKIYSEKQPDEIIIAFNHGGEEYQTHSNGSQQTFYRALIDRGVDIVIGSHPHVTQEVETYKSKPIFYSLGNFIFDQYFSDEVQKAMAVKFTFYKDTFTYEIIPLKSVRSQPAVIDNS